MRTMSQESQRVHKNCNITPLLASEVPTEDSKVSMWFSSDIGESIVIVVEGRIITDFIDEVIKEFLFLFLFAFSFRGGNWNRLGKVILSSFFDCFGFGRV